MSDLRPELRDALQRLHEGAWLETLPGDASSRRFHRLHLAEGGTRIVMDYGAPFLGETDDVRLARIYERAALPVARVLDVLEAAGCLLLEDLGTVTLEDALTRADERGHGNRLDLYHRAVELAAAVASRGSAVLAASDRASGPALDEDRFRFEMRYFAEHFLQGYLCGPPPSSDLARGLDELAREVASHPRVMCHRDFHSRNLMVRGDGALAMVDIQDSRWGPDTYDIASLLRDAYVDLEEGEVTALFDRFLGERQESAAPGDIRRRFHLVATQRMIKALGTFGYQVAVMGRSRYRDAIPRTLGRLRATLRAHPDTQALGSALHATGLFG